MSNENKRNLQYFEAPSMRELFAMMQTWQNENDQRFLSLGIENDGDRFCCVALTNPSEVCIVNGPSLSAATVRFGCLHVTSVK